VSLDTGDLFYTFATDSDPKSKSSQAI